jgi:hypothetical protein
VYNIRLVRLYRNSTKEVKVIDYNLDESLPKGYDSLAIKYLEASLT